MKNIVSLILLISFSYSATCQTDSVSTSPTPYDIKSCKITYRFINGIQQGTKTIVFDDYGRKEKMIASTVVSNVGNAERNAGDTTHEMIIKSGAFLYKVNLKDGTGFKLNRGETLPLNLNALRPGQVLIGEDTVLDRSCVVIEVFGSLRTWYWNRIAIKKLITGSGMSTKIEEYAIEIDENYIPDRDEFEVPEGIRLK